MNSKLTASNLAPHLRKTFPEFQGYDDYEDNKIAYFNFFTIFLMNNFNSQSILERAGAFINLMCESGDGSLDSVLDDFCINMHSLSIEKGVDISMFLAKLSAKGREIYNINIDLWTKRNG